jgi:uncharacterized membrane protein YgcG
LIDPATLSAFADELEKIAASNGGYKRVFKVKRLFGKIKRMHKKKNFKRVHKKWKYKRPSAGGGGGGSGGGGGNQ